MGSLRAAALLLAPLCPVDDIHTARWLPFWT